tara:strand:+ start:2481 stop:2648 length:168 start_codon:yes stop_codon:yes gene_type:complete
MERLLKTVEETISEIIDNQAKIVHLIKALNTRLEQLEKINVIIPVTEINDESRAD